MGIKKAIYEHLITKPKYNKKCLEVDTLKEDIARLNIRMNEQKNIFDEQKTVWTEELRKQEEEIIKLKKKLSRTKEKTKKETE